MRAQLIHVQVSAGAKKNQVEKVDETTFNVEVRARPQRGEANEAVRFMLAGYFQVPVNRLRIVTGRLSTHKVVEIR